MIIISAIIWLSAIAIAITIHEYAHAWAADKLGDPTARVNDRLSLNPLNHYDPVGTTMLLFTALLAINGAPIIPLGWAKPVPFDPYNLDNPKRDGALIALAGPVVNLIFASILALILRFVMEIPLLNVMLVAHISLNVGLAIFNLVPIHPLDGSKILLWLLPRHVAIEFEDFVERYSPVILILLIFPFGGRSLIGQIISPIIHLITSILIP